MKGSEKRVDDNPGRVLIVGEPRVVAEISHILSGHGFATAGCDTAEEALARLRVQPFDVVLADRSLPGMGAAALIQTLHQIDPLLVGIATSDAGAIPNGVSRSTREAVDFLSGPSTLAAVAPRVHQALELRRLRTENRDLREAKAGLEQARQRGDAVQEQLLDQERLRALGQMAGRMAHDVNNVLAPILGLSELLLDRPELRSDPARVERYVRDIHTAARDGAEMVARLREFYREAGSDPVEPVLLPPVAERAIALLLPHAQERAHARGATVEVRLDLRPVPAVLGDASQWCVLLTNLISNAFDAMPDGGRLTVTTEAGEGKVRVHVTDTGHGMAGEECRRCLEPFFTTKGTVGAGLGLAMVHGIVRRHGGTLTIRSEPGLGSTFTISVPIGRAVEPPPLRPSVPDAVHGQCRALKVLLVDDERPLQEVTAAYLGLDGHQVRCASDGAEALACLREESFDVVITDQSMPGMPGDQLATAIKKAVPGIPLILYTGFAIHMEAQREIPASMDAVLAKPATIESLRAVIARVTPPAASPVAAR